MSELYSIQWQKFRAKFNKKHFIYIVSRVHYALLLIYWLRLKWKKTKQPQIKKKLLNGKEKLWSKRKKEKKILCTDDDADGTWVYKNNNSFFYGLSSFPFRAEASFIYFSLLFKLLYYFYSTSSPYNVLWFFFCSDIFSVFFSSFA